MGQENLCAEILQNDEFWLHLFQNSLFLLGQNERIVVNLKISWAMWNPSMETFSVKRKFVG
jgi:hypothetical protein